MWGCPSGSVEDPPASAGDTGDMSLIPGSGRSPEEGSGNPLQYSCLEIPRTEEPGGLQSRGLQSPAQLSMHAFTHGWQRDFNHECRCLTAGAGFIFEVVIEWSWDYFHEYFLNIVTGAWLPCNVMPVSAVGQRESAVSVQMSLPAPPWPLEVTTEPRAGLPLLHSSSPLAVYFTRGVCTCQCCSQLVPSSPSPTVTTSLFSTSLSLCLPYK